MHNDDNSMLWLFLLLFMMAQQPATTPMTEEICKQFQERVDTYLKNNEHLVLKARTGSMVWQLATLSKAARDISDLNTRMQVLTVAISIMDHMDEMNKFACGEIPNH